MELRYKVATKEPVETLAPRGWATRVPRPAWGFTSQVCFLQSAVGHEKSLSSRVVKLLYRRGGSNGIRTEPLNIWHVFILVVITTRASLFCGLLPSVSGLLFESAQFSLSLVRERCIPQRRDASLPCDPFLLLVNEWACEYHPLSPHSLNRFGSSSLLMVETDTFNGA